MMVFYTLNWEEHHTGILRTRSNMVNVGVTEMQFVLISFMIAQGLTDGALTEWTCRDVAVFLIQCVYGNSAEK